MRFTVKLITRWLSACILLHVRLTRGRLHGDDDNSIGLDHQTHGHVNRHLAEDNEHSRSCGTKPMTEADRIGRDSALAYVNHKKKKHGEAYNVNSPKIIPTCFHAVSMWPISVTSAHFDLKALNKAFSAKSCCDKSLNWCSGNCTSANPNIQFVMARSLFGHYLGTTKSKHSLLSCVLWRPRRKLEPLKVELETKRKARVGDGRVLNIYYYDLPGDRDGWAYFPSILQTFPELDGVVINWQYRRGGPLHLEGDTLVHQVGHWLGVQHTYEGGCQPGDGIVDTPAEELSYYGFECDPSKRRDTCPEQDGIDPIHNYMDQASEACMFDWTQGQVDVMHANIEFYRSRDLVDIRPIALTVDVISSAYTLADKAARQFYLDISGDGVVACQTYADNGNLELYMNWDGRFGGFECMSEQDYSNELCFIGPKSGRAYLWAYATTTVIDFTIRCTVVSDSTEGGTVVDGIAKTDVVLGKSELISYTMDLPSTGIYTVKCSVAGSADVDLFMSFSNSYFFVECLSMTPNSGNENCTMGPYAGTAYIWVFAAMSNATINLECTLTPPQGGATEIFSGVASPEFTVAPNQILYYYMKVPMPSTVICNSQLHFGGGALSLTWEFTNEYDCDYFHHVHCVLHQPSRGIAFVSILGYPWPNERGKFTCETTTLEPIPLVNNVDSGPHSLDESQWTLFMLHAPTASLVTCKTSSSSGDLDIAMNLDGSKNYLCISDGQSSNKNCMVRTIGAGNVYIYAFGNTGVSSYTIICSLSA